MAVGPCGINCDVCLLRELGTCSTCGPGDSKEAEQKLGAQERILGGVCEVLRCAVERSIRYCPLDCFDFPCKRFEGYPFSESFLAMQRRRRSGHLYILDPNKSFIEVPHLLWEEVLQLGEEELSKRSLFEISKPGWLSCQSLGRRVYVDLNGKKVHFDHPTSKPSPLFEVVLLSHLRRAKDSPLREELVGLKDLKGAQFFEGSHKIETGPIKRAFDRGRIDPKRLIHKLGAQKVSLGDLGIKFSLFPRVPVWLVYWRGDQDFGSEISFLFDKSILDQMPVDAIWGAIYLIMEAILHAHFHSLGSFH